MLLFWNVGFRHQVYAGVSASMGSFVAATLFGWVTPILPWLLSPESEIPMTAQEASWMISFPEFANLVTPIPAGIMANRIGRKPVLLTAAPLIAINWMIILYFKSFESLLIGRTLHGAAAGLIYTTVPVYLGEIASNKYRGAITSLFFIFSWSGFLFEYCTGPFLSFTNYTLLTLSLAFVFFIMLWFQPESPHYFLMQNQIEKARKSFKWFHSESQEVIEDEFKEMVKFYEGYKIPENSLKSVLRTPADRKALSLLLFANSIRVLSGTFCIVSYATRNFTISKNLTVAPEYITILLGIVLVLGACSSFAMADVFGRRPLLLFSSLGSALSLLTISGFYYLSLETSVDVSDYTWVAPVATIIFAGVVVGGIYPVTTAYTSEMFLSHARTTASSICNVYATALTLIILKLYQNFIDVFGMHFNFLLFGSICLFSTIVSYFVMPETKNKSFEQIRLELSK